MVTPVKGKEAWWLKDKYSRKEIDKLVEWGRDHFWIQNHQMADLVATGGYNIIVKGDGCYIWDIEGKKYIDGMGGLLLKNIGHNRPEVANAVAQQMTSIAYANSGAYSNIPGILLAKKISELAPYMHRTVFAGGGSEANELAMKMARQYQFIRGKPMKSKFIWRRGQYHGSSRGAMGVGTAGTRGQGMFYPMTPMGGVSVDQPFCYMCPWGFTDRTNKNCCMQSARSMENAIKAEGAETIAGFMAAPITNPSMIPPEGYYPAVRELCDKYDILFIADEVICGFGRLGTWFGMQRFGVEPDIQAMAKGLTSGELPIGAVAATKKVTDVFDNAKGELGAFQHGVTFGGHPAVMAAAMKNVEILERENLVENSDQMGRYLYDRLMSVLQENHSSVGYVGGGLGLWASIEMVKNRKTKERYPGGPQGAYAKRFTEKLREYGLATRAGDTISLSPPLVITKEIIDDMVDILDRATGEMESEFPPDSA